MKVKIISVSLMISLTFQLGAQDKVALTLDDYKGLVENGLTSLEGEKYDSCITYFKSAFTIKQTSYLSTMRAAACAYSAGDQAYFNQELNKAFSLNWGCLLYTSPSPRDS